MSPSWRRLAVALLGSLVLAGCARRGIPSPRSGSSDENVLMAYVACALVPAVEIAAAKFEAENPGKSVEIKSGQPSDLVRSIEQGDRPDVFVCLGDSEIGMLERAGTLDRSLRREVGSFRLALAVPAGKPLIGKAEDLASRRVKTIVMSVPGITSLGTDGKRALERAGVWKRVQSRLVLHETGAQALEALAQGKADAAVVYTPCPLLQVAGKVPANAVTVGDPLSASSERPARVHLGIHKRSSKTRLGQRFIAAMRSSELKADLAAVGIPAEQ